MDMSVFAHRGRFQTGRYLGESSAASTWSFVTVGFVGLDLFAWILIIESLGNLWEILAILLCILGGVFVIIGGYIAHKEWEM